MQPTHEVRDSFWTPLYYRLLAKLRLALALVSLGWLVVSRFTALLNATCIRQFLQGIERLVPALLLMFKLVYAMVHRQSLNYICDCVRSIQQIADFTGEFDNYCKHTVNNILGFCLSFVHLLYLAFTKSHRFPASNMLSTVETQRYFISVGFLLICQAMGLSFAITVVAKGDVNMMCLIIELSRKFTLISTQFRSIGHCLSIGLYLNRQDLASHMRQCISQHQLVIKMALNVRTLFRPVLLSQVLTSNLMIKLTERTTAVQVLTLALTLGQIFAWKWLDKLLIYASSNVAEMVYLEIPYYCLPKNLRRDIGLVCFRAQHPCCLVYNFTDAGHFAKVITATSFHIAIQRSMK